MGENNGDGLRFVSPGLGTREIGDEFNFSSQENEWLLKEFREETSKEDFLWAISEGLEPKITVGNETFYDSDLGSLRNFDEWMSDRTMDEITQQRYAEVEKLVSNAVGREMSFSEIVQLVVDEEGMMMVYWDDRNASYSRRLGIVSVPWTESRQLEVLDEWRSAMWPPLTEEQVWEREEYQRAQKKYDEEYARRNYPGEYEDRYWHKWLGSREEAIKRESDEQDRAERQTTRWRPEKSTADHLEQLRMMEDAEPSMSDENWGDAGYKGDNDDGLTDEDRRDWEMLQRLFESDDEHLRQQALGSQINGEKNPDQRRALQQWVAKQGRSEEKRTQGVEVKPRGRDETSVDSKTWTRRRHATNLGRSKAPDTNFSDPTYGDAQRDAGERRAKEKLEWQRDVEQGVEDINSPDRFWDEYEEYLDTLPEETREWSYADVEDVNEGLTDHMPTREDILKKLKNSSSNKWSRMAWRGDMRMQGKSPQKEKPPYYTDEQWEEVKRIGELKGLVAEIKLKRRIDEHRRKLQGQVTQQRQEQKHRSSERVDWYKKMMRDRNAKSRETRERGGGARHPGLAVGIPQVKGK